MTIAQNKKAFHDYFIEERYEAGLVLEGWEAKAIRSGRVQLKDAYVLIRGGEIYMVGGHISALPTASTHINPDPVRTRKLLLHGEEIQHLIGKVERAGYTLVPLDMHYKNGREAKNGDKVLLIPSYGAPVAGATACWRCVAPSRARRPTGCLRGPVL